MWIYVVLGAGMTGVILFVLSMEINSWWLRREEEKLNKRWDKIMQYYGMLEGTDEMKDCDIGYDDEDGG